MQAVNPYATEFDNDGSNPRKSRFWFSEHAIKFANNGIQLEYFLIFGNAPITTRASPRESSRAAVVHRLRHSFFQRTKFIR